MSRLFVLCGSFDVDKVVPISSVYKIEKSVCRTIKSIQNFKIPCHMF